MEKLSQKLLHVDKRDQFRTRLFENVFRSKSPRNLSAKSFPKPFLYSQNCWKFLKKFKKQFWKMVNFNVSRKTLRRITEKKNEKKFCEMSFLVKCVSNCDYEKCVIDKKIYIIRPFFPVNRNLARISVKTTSFLITKVQINWNA